MKSRIMIGLVLVFLAGLATGVFAGAWHARHAFTGRHGAHMGERMRQRLQEELNLNPEQARKMTPILDETAQRLQEIRRDTGRRVEETIADAHERLSRELTPEQQAEFRELQKRHRRFWRWHRRPGPPPHGP